MKRPYRILGAVGGLIVTLAFAAYVARALRGHDLSIYASPRAFLSIIIASLIYCAGLPLTALGWRKMLEGVGVQKTWRELTAILAITQFAKYIPGNVGQYVGRTGMSLSRNIPARPFTVTIVLETLLVFAAALTVGLGAGALSQAGFAIMRNKAWQLVAIAAILLLVTICLLAFRKYAPRLLKYIAPKQAHQLEDVQLPAKSLLARAFLFYCGSVLCIGIALVTLAYLLLPQAPHPDWLLLACVALAWLIGFVTPGAPAGLGVREGLLLLMLGPTYTAAVAGILIIALRLATTLGDVFCFIGGLLLLPRKMTPASIPPTA